MKSSNAEISTRNRTAQGSELFKIHNHVLALEPSATLAINAHASRLRADGHDLVHFGFGQSPFPVPEPVVQALREHAHHKAYLPVAGLHALREAICGFRNQHGFACASDELIIGPGSKELIFHILLAIDMPLLLPSPSWVSYAPQAALVNKPVHWIDTGKTGWKLTPGALEKGSAQVGGPAILLLNSPSNPTGVVYSESELSELAAVARRQAVIVIADEIYSHLTFDGSYASILPFYPEGTIVTSGLSKWCGAGGWRLGFAQIPDVTLRQAMHAIASETYTSVSSPVQYAACVAYCGGPQIDTYLDKSRHILAALADYTQRTLNANGIHTLAPAGGFYCMPDFTMFREMLATRGIQTSVALCEALIKEAQVALLPGVAFGRPASELTSRLAFVDFDGAVALAHIDGLDTDPDQWIVQHANQIKKGVQRITQWVQQL